MLGDVLSNAGDRFGNFAMRYLGVPLIVLTHLLAGYPAFIYFACFLPRFTLFHVDAESDGGGGGDGGGGAGDAVSWLGYSVTIVGLFVEANILYNHSMACMTTSFVAPPAAPVVRATDAAAGGAGDVGDVEGQGLAVAVAAEARLKRAGDVVFGRYCQTCVAAKPPRGGWCECS
jgi:hypothetical protein